tara:strand:+ start:6784 stop:7455 length:672 start_codon:yes stop_codon:yes gene_type:complete
MQEDKPPVRFAILSAQRCGSHLVAGLLEARGCRCKVEIVKRHGSAQELYDEALAVEPGTKPPVGLGFILHRCQAWGDSPGAGLWPIIREDSGLRIILLHRANQLARYASHQLARRSGNWHQRRTRGTLTVSPLALAKDVANYWRQYAAALEMVAGRRVFKLEYGSVCEAGQRRQAAMRELFDFLGLSYSHVEPTTIKQELRPLFNVVENYTDLQDAGLVFPGK